MAKTNSASSLRLQPNKSNNIGNIVQEYIRYNRKYEDEKTAREKIEKAREAEFKYKIDGDVNKLLQSIAPTDPIGMINSRLAEVWEKQQPEIAELARSARNGNTTDRIKLNNIVQKWKVASNVGKSWKAKINEYNTKIKAGQFNSIRDEPFLDLAESASLKGLSIDDNLNFNFTNKKGEDVSFSAMQMGNNEFLTHQLGTPAKFQGKNEYGNAILQATYGQNPNLTDEQFELVGIKEVKNLFATDPNEKVTWYGTYLKQNGVDPRQADPYDKLDSFEQTKIAKAYLDKNVIKPVKTLKEKQAEANLYGTNLRNQKTSKELDLLKNPIKKEEKEKPTFNTISIKKDPVTKKPITKESGTGETFEVALPNEISYGGNTNSKGTKIQSATVDEFGNVFFNGVKPNGESITISDPQEVGDIVTKIPNGNSKDSRFKDIVEFSKKANEILNPKTESVGTSNNNASRFNKK